MIKVHLIAQILLFSVVNDLLSIPCFPLVLLYASDIGELLTERFSGSKGKGRIYLQPTTCLYSFYLKHRSRFVITSFVSACLLLQTPENVSMSLHAGKLFYKKISIYNIYKPSTWQTQGKMMYSGISLQKVLV